MKDWSNDPVWRQYAEHALKEMLPKLKDSAVSISLVPSEGDGDVKYWTELGASIMLDKPILVLVSPGQEIPERLRRVADGVIVADLETGEGREALTRSIEGLMNGLEDR